MDRSTRTVGALAALALLAPASVAPAAPGAPREPAQDAAARQDDVRTQRRIVHLRGGGALRGVTRRADGGWEIKRDGRWLPVLDRQVERVVEERAALRQWRATLSEAGRAEDEPAARAAAVRLGFEVGLYQEALDAAEVLLRDHPRSEAARFAVTDHAHLLGVPEVPAAADGSPDFEAHFAWASQRGAALREVAILRLAQASVPARDALREALVQQLSRSLPARRSYGALALGRLYPGESLRELFVHALRDAAGPVRAEAARAVGRAGDEGLVLPLVRVLDASASPRLRRHAAEALGHMGHRTAVEPLVGRLAALAAAPAAQAARSGRVPHSHIFIGRQFAYIQDFDVEVAQLQSVADPQVNVLIEGGVLDAGVIGTREYIAMVGAERASIQRALGDLTGERPGGRARDWIRWWDERSPAAVDAGGGR